MLSRAVGSFAARNAHSSSRVAVLGAAGGIGQPLSMLLKLNSNVTELSLFDVVPMVNGVASDLSHCSSPAQIVKGVAGADNVKEALEGADVVVIPAGLPRKPGMTRDDLFQKNAGIVKGLAEACGSACPNATILVISNPVNSMVPVFAETLRKMGVYNPRKLFGVSTLDCVRANTFVAQNQGFDVSKTNVKVIGGHAGTTILPLLSQVPGAKFSDDDISKLTHRIQFGGDEVVKAKDGAGSATLSMAYAGALFTDAVVRARHGEKGITECTFVENNLTDAPFFATQVTLGEDGIETIHEFGKLSAFEQKNFDEMLPDLIDQARKGSEFVKKN